MTLIFYLFDMDGVLLHPGGYHQSLQDSVKKIAKSLGAPNIKLSSDQIATFEALNITNEWDSLAICTALILIHVWKFNADIRLDNFIKQTQMVTPSQPNFDIFLANYSKNSDLPGHSAYQMLINEHHWLDSGQRNHLAEILLTCRDIFRSPTLPMHQERILGSQIFEDVYGLQPKINQDSYLLSYDRPAMNQEQTNALGEWLNHPNHCAGIMTNRPSATPNGHISPPEAELGAKLVGLEYLPILGSGLLNWYAVEESQENAYIFLKPNPVHALGLIQMCLGQANSMALKLASDLWQKKANQELWQLLGGAKVVIFEDSAKGLQCGIAARDLLKKIGVDIELTLVGVAQNPIKMNALNEFADITVSSINDIYWHLL